MDEKCEICFANIFCDHQQSHCVTCRNWDRKPDRPLAPATASEVFGLEAEVVSLFAVDPDEDWTLVTRRGSRRFRARNLTQNKPVIYVDPPMADEALPQCKWEGEKSPSSPSTKRRSRRSTQTKIINDFASYLPDERHQATVRAQKQLWKQVSVDAGSQADSEDVSEEECKPSLRPIGQNDKLDFASNLLLENVYFDENLDPGSHDDDLSRHFEFEYEPEDANTGGPPGYWVYQRGGPINRTKRHRVAQAVYENSYVMRDEHGRRRRYTYDGRPVNAQGIPTFTDQEDERLQRDGLEAAYPTMPDLDLDDFGRPWDPMERIRHCEESED